MKHLGDITKIDGRTVEPVDVIIGGSPCQRLSIAGKGEGLKDERSALFLEQIRIVKEMREADEQRGRTGINVRPRFMVWENVPGAFRRNKGEDFKIVLEETIRIAEPEAPDIPLPKKWPLADAYYGDGWSVAYRVLDAQFWGVPQRRRRIALVADFGGHAAPEILFVRESVCGDIAESGATGEEATAGTGSGAKEASCYRISSMSSFAMLSENPYAGIAKTELARTIDRNGGDPTLNQGGICVLQEVAGFKANAGGKVWGLGYAQELSTTLDTGSHMAVFDSRGNGDGKTVCTLTGDHQSRVTDYTAIVMATGQAGAEITEDISPTLNCNHEQPIIAHTLRARGQDENATDLDTYPITRGVLSAA